MFAKKFFPQDGRDELPLDKFARVRIGRGKDRFDFHARALREDRGGLPVDFGGEGVVRRHDMDVDRNAPGRSEVEQARKLVARVDDQLQSVGTGEGVGAGARDLRIVGGGRGRNHRNVWRGGVGRFLGAQGNKADEGQCGEEEGSPFHLTIPF